MPFHDGPLPAPPEGEREQMLPKVTAAVPAFAESQAKTKRVIPLFELQRV